MDKLKLHSEGRKEYLEQLDLQFKTELNEIKKKADLSEVAKKEAILQLRSKFKQLKDQSGYSLF